ncbi:MAG: transporter [Sphingomonas bacterium]|nr:transporter [Sphingomonas bacterium]
MKGTAIPAGAAVKLGGAASWYMLVLLTMTAGVSLLDRQIITILAVDIKRDLNLNDTEIGLLYGTFFAIFYSLFSMPLGRLADGWVRTRQIALSLAGWSLATAACAFATGFGSMALARTAVAVGEAGSAPASTSLLGDIFPRSMRGTIFAIAALAATIGIAMSSALGGLVVDNWNAAFPGGRGWFGLVGWQAAFIAASIPGLILALLLAFVREPVRGLADGIIVPPQPRPFARAAVEVLPLLPGLSILRLRQLDAGPRAIASNVAMLGGAILFAAVTIAIFTSLAPPERLLVYARIGGFPITSHFVQWAVVAFGLFAILSWVQSQRLSDRPAARVMWSSPAFIATLVVAAGFNVIIYGMMAWIAPFAVTTYKASLSDVGVRIGLIALTLGPVGTLAGGWIADRLRRVHPAGRLWVLLFATALPAPLAWMTFTQTTLDGFTFWFAVMSVVLTPWLPCLNATMQDLVLPRMRGSATALGMLTTTIFGMGTGPYLVGMMSDVSGDLGGAIRGLFFVSPVVWGAILIAILRIERDEATLVDRAREAGEPI